MKLVFRLIVFAALLFLVLFFGKKFLEMNDLAKFGVVLLLGTALGMSVAHYGLPRFADAVVGFLFSWSSEPGSERDEASSPLISLLAQGKYTEGLEECQKQLLQSPMQVFVIAEMVKIYAERLNEPQKAVALVDEQLSLHPWSDDDAAYLKFRQVDALLHGGDKEGAIEKLSQIVALYPVSKHFGSAMHRLHELQTRQVLPTPEGWSEQS